MEQVGDLEELWQHEWSVTFWSWCSPASLTTLAMLMLLTLLAAKLYGRLTMHKPRAASWLRQLPYTRFMWLQCRKVYYMGQLMLAALTFRSLSAWHDVGMWLVATHASQQHPVPAQSLSSATVQATVAVGVLSTLPSLAYRAARTVQVGAATALARIGG